MGVHKDIELKPIKESSKDYEDIERRIKRFFKYEIYLPILKLLGEKSSAITNSSSSLLLAIKSGRVQFHSGRFTGKLSAPISRDLRSLGAIYEQSDGSYRIKKADLPYEVRSAISSSYATFQRKIDAIDQRLAKILPEEITDKLNLDKLFDRALWKVDRSLHKTMKSITVVPQLTPERRKRIADEWTKNMDLYIKDFKQKEIKELRERMQKTVFAGNRYESAVDEIKKSYGVSERKAKFLARQETSLLMTKFKQIRYEEAGVKRYKWTCVTGTPLHPVRPMHKALGDRSKNGETFTWSNPPITNPEGNKNNPGQDYNCRCYAIPIVSFKREKE